MSILSILYTGGKFLLEYKIPIIISILFLSLSIYYYTRIVAPNLNKKYVPNKEFKGLKGEPPKSATLYYFYTTWCPICKKSDIEWGKLDYPGADHVINGVNIIFKKIDCDKDPTTADKFEVTGYPTIKLVYDNKTYEFDAKPDEETLLKFLNDILK